MLVPSYENDIFIDMFKVMLIILENVCTTKKMCLRSQDIIIFNGDNNTTQSILSESIDFISEKIQELHVDL